MLGEPFERRERTPGERRSTQPTTPRMKSCSLGEPEEIFRFRQALAHLHGDRPVEAVSLENRLEVRGREIAADARHPLVDPVVLALMKAQKC